MELSLRGQAIDTEQMQNRNGTQRNAELNSPLQKKQVEWGLIDNESAPLFNRGVVCMHVWLKGAIKTPI